MLVMTVYAVCVFALCFISIKFLRQKLQSLLIVAAWTVLGPIVMQVLNYFLVGFLDPFWQWAALVQGVIALAASVAALMVSAAIESSKT
jgi:MFS family permease